MYYFSYRLSLECFDLNIIIEEENDKICAIYPAQYNIYKNDVIKRIQKETNIISQAFIELEEYFHHQRKYFDLPLDLIGTPFEKEVWQELQNIPYGSKVSYKDIAIKINRPQAYRAVGKAVAHNPIFIVIPCHRVIGQNGSLTGFAYGLTLKEKL